MLIKSEQKFVKVTPRKLRLVADVVRKMSIAQSLAVLPHIEKRGAKSILKVVKTAVANATQRGISDSDLVFKSVEISQGPKLKRFRAASKGRAHGYVRKMSHIKIVLEEVKKPEVKKIKKVEPKSEKSEKKVVKKSVKK